MALTTEELCPGCNKVSIFTHGDPRHPHNLCDKCRAVKDKKKEAKRLGVLVEIINDPKRFARYLLDLEKQLARLKKKS